MVQVINLLKTLAESIIAIIKFVPKILKDLLMVVSLVLETVTRLPLILGVFPSVVVSILIATFSVVVIYKVLGREG